MTASSPSSLLRTRERDQLTALLRSTTLARGPAVRARILLDLDDGYTLEEVAERQRVGRATVFRWKARYLGEGIGSLEN